MFWWTLLWAGSFVAAGVYLVALRRGPMALVDLIWTGGLGLSALAYYLWGGYVGLRPALVLGILGIWSARLSAHLLSDRILPGREDPRYAALAEHWGHGSRWKFAFLFLVQVPFVMLFLLPVTVAMRNPAHLGVMDAVAVLLALCALVGEAVADRQLAAFRSRANNKETVCADGLWRYSRHPNYFFEWLHWWSYVAFAWGAPDAGLALVGPVSMYVFLRFITGVPPAERSSLRRRGPAYRAYQAETNAFFPWKPRRNS